MSTMQAVAAILKRRFPNLTVEETIGLVEEIVDAVRESDRQRLEAALKEH